MNTIVNTVKKLQTLLGGTVEFHIFNKTMNHKNACNISWNVSVMRESPDRHTFGLRCWSEERIRLVLLWQGKSTIHGLHKLVVGRVDGPHSPWSITLGAICSRCFIKENKSGCGLSHFIAWPQDYIIYGISPTIINININIQYDKQ